MGTADKPEKVLVLRFSALGDIINATAAVGAVRALCPEAEIDFLAAKGFEAAVEGCPEIRRVIVYDRGRNLENLSGFLGLARELRRERYDWVVNCQRNTRSRVLARLAGARTNPCADKADYKRPDFDSNVIDVIGNEILSCFDPALAGHCDMLFWTTPAQAAFASEFMAAAGLDTAPVIGFNPGGAWPSKQWPANNWIALGRRVVNELGLRALVLGGPDEADRALEIARGIGPGAGSAAGRTSFRGAGALMSRCAAVVSNDSGLMHLAASVPVPVIGLFGPTNSGYHGPLGPGSCSIQAPNGCDPCYRKQCPEGRECMAAIGPDQVFDALTRALDRE